MTETLSSQEVLADVGYAPASEESPAIAMDYIVEKILNRYRWITPAVVEEYDREKNIITVTPALKDTTTDKSVELCKLEVPCVVIGGGGWVTSYPLVKGNTGWLLSNDRDISLFIQSKKVSEPNTLRRHDFADSVFLPDVISDFKHDKKEDKEATVFQNLKGEIKAAIDEKSLRIKFKDKVSVVIDKESVTIKTEKATVVINKENVSITAEKEITAKSEKITLTADKQITAKSEKILLEGEVTVEGTLKVTKDATFDSNVEVSGNEDVGGNVTASDCIGGGKSLASHTHQGVHGPTGGPQ